MIEPSTNINFNDFDNVKEIGSEESLDNFSDDIPSELANKPRAENAASYQLHAQSVSNSQSKRFPPGSSGKKLEKPGKPTPGPFALSPS
jgi:hypothetical protein